MHVNSFNMKKENGALADRMGIVVGTSHCDMLMRSNNREWKPWIAKKGYTDAAYDYSIPGRNREILQEYWRESVEQNRDFEVCYTLVCGESTIPALRRRPSCSSRRKNGRLPR